MRIMLVIALSAAALFTGSGASQAKEGPWCAHVDIGAGAISSDCHFQSIEDCRPHVIAGNKGFCTQNPSWPGYYAPVSTVPKPHRKRHARHH
jgi:hypothetical protein